MSSSSRTTYEQSDYRAHGLCNGNKGKCGNWSGFNIAAMILGFVLFWPIGLFILYWILTGRNVRDLPQAMRQQWSTMTGYWHRGDSPGNGPSDNVVFNEYQQTQYDRIHEIKEEIKARSRRFYEFRADAKRRADEEEFNRFMADAPGRTEG